jgi:DNA-binding transcriptional LysR family regulator
MSSIGMENLRGMLAFVRAAEARSFTAAARQLGVSPSGVSKAITRLEACFRVRLMHRTSRSVTMTPEGAALYERCRHILAELEDAEELLSRARQVPRGRLRVTLPLSIGRLHLARLLPEFAQRYPEVKLEASATDRVVDLVEEGFDLAVRLGRPRDSRLVARRLAGGVMVTCASPAYLRRHGTPRRPEDLARHNCARFVVPATGVVRDWQFQRNRKPFTVEVTGNFTFDHAECLVEAATAGTAIIQMPSYVLSEAIDKRRLDVILTAYQVEGPSMWLMYPQNRHLTPRVRAFADFLVASAEAGKLSTDLPARQRERRGGA